MKTIEQMYGVQYLESDSPKTIRSRSDDMYHYILYHGNHEQIVVDSGDSIYFIKDQVAHVIRGPTIIDSDKFAVVVRGYTPPNKSASIVEPTVLPYINGCSTRQIIPPERIGDPTMQMLYMPPHTSEQYHHIHSTVRVVYVLEGRGWSVVGTSTKTVRQQLSPGMTIVLEKMCPHHFETEDNRLTVLPVHIWSALPGGLEQGHPMFNGTIKL